MSQASTLRALDADLVQAMLDAGFADSSTYTPPGGGTPVPCTVLVDRALQLYGEDASGVAGQRTAITLFYTDVANPERLGMVIVGNEIFKLDELDARDESMSRWVVICG